MKSRNGTYLRPDGSTGSSTSITRSSSPVPHLHPLTSSSISQPPSPSTRANTSNGVRSRRSAQSTPNPPSTPSFATQVDEDVTRPSLKRITDTTNLVVEGATLALSRQQNGASASSSSASSSARTSFDELTSRQAKPKEKEVIVHQVIKTDTIASIALQYGITPQALRSSNRLWPSDSIHLRKTLNVPLDQCHLPSASAGIERIEREEDGNIVVWQRDRVASSSSSSSQSGPTSPIDSSSSSSSSGGPFSSSRPGVISPKARRIHSGSTLEFSLNRVPSTADLLGLDATTPTELPDDPRTAAFDSMWGAASRPIIDAEAPSWSNGTDLKGKGRAMDAVSAYLPSTNNPYSASSSPAPAETSTADSRLAGLGNSMSPSPFDAFGSPSPSPLGTDLSSGASNASLSPPPISKRVLTISRVPESSLAFFPPSATADYTYKDDDSPSDRLTEEHLASHSSKGSFFGPLANSLAKFNLSSTTTSSPATWSSNASERSHTNGSTSNARMHGPSGNLPYGGKSPKPSRHQQRTSQRSKWDLAYFGAEEMEFATRPSAQSGRNEASASSRPIGIARSTSSSSQDTRDRLNKTPTQASMDLASRSNNKKSTAMPIPILLKYRTETWLGRARPTKQLPRWPTAPLPPLPPLPP
ncbi:hypothetical protein OIO90_001808 [Microbotryomycetes sp. JL221]|nr:hypothetical protein OIO90_001808 [Microbotryomycetes sp. JL221]